MVDDDAGIRRFTANALTYCVNREILSFRDGAAAWEYLKNGGRADMLISDVDMPEMSGIELLTRVKARFTDMIVIIMSGKEENEAIAEANGADGFLGKPFAVTDLFDIVQAYVVD